MYAWVFWCAKKSLKSTNNAPVCYSYHNPNTLVWSEIRAMVEQYNNIKGRHV
jgi:hypothetical protein